MKIAITGGIGVGKSEVMKIISDLGYTTVYCDEINGNLLKDDRYIQKIQKVFPEVVTDGKVDKSLLRELVFSNDEKRIALNGIAHPEILEKAFSVEGDFVFIEIPLLSTDIVKRFDAIVCITCDMNERINRIVKRSNDKISKDMAKKIIDCQVDDKIIMDYSNYIIENDGDIELLKAKTTNVIKNITRQAKL